jgi:hypothetical protein
MLKCNVEKVDLGCGLTAKKVERLPDLGSLIEEMKSRNFNITKLK